MTVNRKMTKLLLIIALLATVVFPVSVFAEKGDINSIEFESSAKLDLVVGQTPKQLKVFANVEGSSSKRCNGCGDLEFFQYHCCKGCKRPFDAV